MSDFLVFGLLVLLALWPLPVWVALWYLPDQRVGSEPFCGVCRYCLAGSPGPRCPEFGAVMAEHAVIGRPLVGPAWADLIRWVAGLGMAAAIATILLCAFWLFMPSVVS